MAILREMEFLQWPGQPDELAHQPEYAVIDNMIEDTKTFTALAWPWPEDSPGQIARRFCD